MWGDVNSNNDDYSVAVNYNPAQSTECIIEEDLDRYDELLQDGIVIKTFLKTFPLAVSHTSGTIDESSPPQSQIIYKYESGDLVAQLNVNVFEGKMPERPCLYPSQYVLNYQNDDDQTVQIINYFTETQEIVDFLNDNNQQQRNNNTLKIISVEERPIIFSHSGVAEFSFQDDDRDLRQDTQSDLMSQLPITTCESKFQKTLRLWTILILA